MQQPFAGSREETANSSPIMPGAVSLPKPPLHPITGDPFVLGHRTALVLSGSIPAHVAPPTEPRFSPPSLGLPFCLPQLGGDEFSIRTLKHVCVTNYDANNSGFSASGPTSSHGTLGGGSGALGSREVGTTSNWCVCWGQVSW